MSLTLYTAWSACQPGALPAAVGLGRSHEGEAGGGRGPGHAGRIAGNRYSAAAHRVIDTETFDFEVYEE
jgi:hypothetical protein